MKIEQNSIEICTIYCFNCHHQQVVDISLTFNTDENLSRFDFTKTAKKKGKQKIFCVLSNKNYQK
jgi:hypothetical protein